MTVQTWCDMGQLCSSAPVSSTGQALRQAPGRHFAGTTHAGCDRHTKGWKWLRRRQSELTTATGDWIPAFAGMTMWASHLYFGTNDE